MMKGYIYIVVSPIKWLGGNLYLIILDFPIGSTEYVIINYVYRFNDNIYRIPDVDYCSIGVGVTIIHP